MNNLEKLIREELAFASSQYLSTTGNSNTFVKESLERILTKAGLPLPPTNTPVTLVNRQGISITL